MTAHNSAKLEDIAETVIMPGDPLRSKMIVDKYLIDAKLVNNVRGVQGYTGLYRGKKVTIMSSGMGNPSMGIYSYELFKFYNVKIDILLKKFKIKLQKFKINLKLFEVSQWN